MQTFIELAKSYQSYHTKPATLYTHFVGVPLVLLSFMLLLGCIKISIPGVISTDLAWILATGLVIYYVILNWRVGLITVPLMILLLWVAYMFNGDGPSLDMFYAFLLTFIIGMGFQLVGHKLEGNSPAFTDNAFQALVAPLFIVTELCFFAGLFYDLKCELHGPE